jgi:hypothetical protein
LLFGTEKLRITAVTRNGEKIAILTGAFHDFRHRQSSVFAAAGMDVQISFDPHDISLSI